MHKLITNNHVQSFQRDGVVLIKGLFSNYIDIIRSGIEYNMSFPGPYAAENLKEGEDGRFFDDYCNWNRISEFEDVIWNSPAAEIREPDIHSARRRKRSFNMAGEEED
jgi:ectoine hydroxylase-related dioxygenase (phytanoyl-CoA dioxygenase family)